jgi:hypothetical protein
VLAPRGVLVVYDFGTGISFRAEAGLEGWFSGFVSRYPLPAHEARKLNPEILAACTPAFRVHEQEQFEIGIRLGPDFYLDYMLTETNVAAALRSGISLSEIKAWCAETLARIWRDGEREVLFRGYFACMRPA